MSGTRGVFAFAHIGDLHLERPGDPNAIDLGAILAEVAGLHKHGLLDFGYLPGDLAEDGWAAQYRILIKALAAHPKLPIRLIAGDHDRQYGKMTDFDALFARVAGSPQGGGHWPRPRYRPRRPSRARFPQYYYAETIGGVRCLFLDMISAGNGQKGFGLDFRLGPRQLAWLRRALAKAERKGLPCAVFTHTYPDDLRVPEEKAELAGLIRGHGVRLVEMGHTHYNELAHDGCTLYASARSVGQNEDGSVGYAVAAIDHGVTSWRFKPLDRALPFVMITGPADRRLATEPLVTEPLATESLVTEPLGASGRQITVRALVLSNEPQAAWCCEARVDGGPAYPMSPAGPRVVEARVPWPNGSRRLAVTVTDGTRNPRTLMTNIDTDTIEPVSHTFVPPLAPDKPGSDAFRTGAWPEKGIRGDQLGPNRNGRPW